MCKKNKQFSGAGIASSQNKLFLCAVPKKKKESGFTLRDCTIAESSVGSLALVGKGLVSLSTLQDTLVNKLQPLLAC